MRLPAAAFPHPLPTDRPRRVVGTMTGTSIDGLDAALVEVDGHGLAMRARLLRHRSERFPPTLRADLRHAAEQRPMTAGSLASLALAFARFHAEAIGRLLAEANSDADLIVAHGQTVFHAPPVSWQLLQPAPIVAALGVTTVCDLRQSDLAAGGQGAPITPLADWILFRSSRPRAIVNLGGFCNVTLLPADAGPDGVRGGDVCACNQVLDAIARELLGVAYDDGGRVALSGRAETGATDRLASALRRQRGERRSLGTGDEALAWLATERVTHAPADIAASAAAAIGTVIGESVRDVGSAGGEILVAGGGARHPGVVAAIAAAAGGPVRPLDAVGVPIEAREAMELAVLGALAQDGGPITIAGITGRGEPRGPDGLWCFANAREPSRFAQR